MTYRDRREAKADRLREWAAKRETKAEAVFASHEVYRGDHAFNFQPGHIPARARVIAQQDRAHESLAKARNMASRADGIEEQLASSIYSDDPDAIEQLEKRLAKLEAEREAIKAHNKAHRGDKGCACPAECACRNSYRPGSCACKKHPLPAYHLTNLSGNIKRNRDRLEALRANRRRAERCEAAGGLIVEPAGDGWVCVTFAEKPADDVLDGLRGAGFFFRSGSWFGKRDSLPAGIT